MGNFGFVMFAGDKAMQHWAKISLTQVFGPSQWFILCEFC